MTLSSDRWSPVLLKELRQGIRSQLFTASFLLIQALLFVFGSSFVMTDGLRKEPSAGTALFWTMLVLPLLVLVPASASQAIEKEKAARTLELLLLTRLSSYRIVVGKWASILLQATLLIVSALPYVMLRYFLGGVDLWNELAAVAELLLASALLAGVAMGFWALNVTRWAKWGILLLLLQMSPVLLLAVFSPHGGLGMPSGIGVVLWLYAAILMLMMLEAAAAKIGPPSENHTSRVRFLALFGLAAACFVSGPSGAVAVVIALAILAVMMIVSLSETTRRIPRLFQPFVAGSRLRRVLWFPFAPSWPGGVAFTALVLVTLPFLPGFRNELPFYVWTAVAGCFFLPAALARRILRRARPLAAYVLVLVLSSVPVYLYGFASAVPLEDLSALLESIAGLFPPLALVVEIAQPHGYGGRMFSRFLLVLVTGASVVAVVRAAFDEWQRIRDLATTGTALSVEELAASGVTLGLGQGSAS